ncbi:CRISPR-associated endonuclease Cas2 [Nocardia sp. CA-084685]|uniref:CRISPR-associated endonuclease Cas2 n=1 Tax=Nocardia sp. CA-084685 TaxID=3239970 RepID=UPI003D98348E
MILKTCRRYLHHVQRSVFEGSLSAAQYRRFQTAVHAAIDPSYDSVLIYTYPPGTAPHRESWGIEQSAPTTIL